MASIITTPTDDIIFYTPVEDDGVLMLHTKLIDGFLHRNMPEDRPFLFKVFRSLIHTMMNFGEIPDKIRYAQQFFSPLIKRKFSMFTNIDPRMSLLTEEDQDDIYASNNEVSLRFFTMYFRKYFGNDFKFEYLARNGVSLTRVLDIETGVVGSQVNETTDSLVAPTTDLRPPRTTDIAGAYMLGVMVNINRFNNSTQFGFKYKGLIDNRYRQKLAVVAPARMYIATIFNVSLSPSQDDLVWYGNVLNDNLTGRKFSDILTLLPTFRDARVWFFEGTTGFVSTIFMLDIIYDHTGRIENYLLTIRYFGKSLQRVEFARDILRWNPTTGKNEVTGQETMFTFAFNGPEWWVPSELEDGNSAWDFNFYLLP